MAAAAAMTSQMALVGAGPLRTAGTQQLIGAATPSLITFPARKRSMVRCDAGNNPIGGLKEAIDRATKKTITKDEILRHQESDESEKKSVFGAEPTSGSFYPRAEVERRPETGDLAFTSVFAFDGAAPETINCRLVRSPHPTLTLEILQILPSITRTSLSIPRVYSGYLHGIISIYDSIS